MPPTTDSRIADDARPVVGRLRGWLDRLPPSGRRVVRRLWTREVMLAGSSLAFYGLVSALPLALLSLAAVEAVVGRQAVQQLSQQASASPGSGVGTVLSELARAAAAPGWGIVLLALWPATAYGGGLRRAFIEARGEREPLPAIKGRIMGLLLVLLLPIVLMAGIPLSFALSRLGGEGLLGTLAGTVLALVGGGLVATLVATLLYQAFTTADFGWRTTVLTAATVGGATSLMSLGFAAYLRLADLEQRYGSGVLGLVLVVAVWLLAANVLLLAGYHALLAHERPSEGQG